MSGKSEKWMIICLLLIVVAGLAWCFRDRFGEKWEGEGMISVTGVGKDLFYIFRSDDGEKQNFTATGNSLTVPAGRYLVQLNGVEREAVIHNGDRVFLESGMLVADGYGLNLYEVWDAAGKKKLNFTRTGNGLEFFQGPYILTLNHVRIPVNVYAGDSTIVQTGQLMVSSAFDGLYYVFDAAGENKLSFASCGNYLEMLPGDYLVRWGENENAVHVEVGQMVKADG